jgi:hypothetical protein
MLAGACSLPVKVKDVISNWPLRKWTPDDAEHGNLRESPEQLRLLWFSAPDTEGWFRVTATDDEQRGWSTFCRVENASQWPLLEITLSAKLRASLAEIGAIDLAAGPSAEPGEPAE